MKQVTTLTWVLGSVSLLGAAVMESPAMAQSSDNLVVQATVESDCSVTGATLNFGTYTGVEKDVEIPISFSCTAPTNVKIAMNGGVIDDPADREMRSPTSNTVLKYDLFQDPTRNTRWGELPNDVQEFPGSTGGTPSVFGRIDGSQSADPGSYSDTVLITLTTN